MDGLDWAGSAEGTLTAWREELQAVFKPLLAATAGLCVSVDVEHARGLQVTARRDDRLVRAALRFQTECNGGYWQIELHLERRRLDRMPPHVAFHNFKRAVIGLLPSVVKR